MSSTEISSCSDSSEIVNYNVLNYEGDLNDLKDDKWNLNYNFDKVVKNISNLKNEIISSAINTETESSVTFNLLNTVPNLRNEFVNSMLDNDNNIDDPNLNDKCNHLTEIVNCLGSQLAVLDEDLTQYKEERIKFEREIYSEIRTMDDCLFERRSTEKFQQMCKIKIKNNVKANRMSKFSLPFIGKRKKSQSTNKSVKVRKRMSICDLTDDQKSRLDLLLEDLGNLEIDTIKTPRSIHTDNNAFKTNNDEENNLKDIEEKLETLQTDDTKLKHSNESDERHLIVKQEWRDVLQYKEQRFRQIEFRLSALRRASIIEDLESEENTDQNQPENETVEKDA